MRLRFASEQTARPSLVEAQRPYHNLEFEKCLEGVSDLRHGWDEAYLGLENECLALRYSWDEADPATGNNIQGNRSRVVLLGCCLRPPKARQEDSFYSRTQWLGHKQASPS
jgi:hypothetical protein